MGRSEENCGFRCAHCRARIEPVTNGSYRNHCPQCLWSRHVDIRPGDRAHPCRGLMAPIGVQRVKRKGLQIVHECLACGAIRVNRTAERSVQPDDFELILELMREGARPNGSRLLRPPLERLQ